MPGPGALQPAVGTAVLVATGTAASVILSYGLAIDRVGAVLVLAVMGAATLYGVKYGVLAALVSAAAFNFFLGTPHFTFRPAARQDVANALMFIAAAWLAGTYTEVLRERRDGVRALYEGVSASGRLWIGDVIEELSPRRWLAREATNLAAALVLVGASVAAAVWLRRFGVELSLFLFAGVTACAVLFGARYALAAAVAAAVATNYLSSDSSFLFDLSAVRDVVSFLFFAGAAWLVGTYSDRVRHERAAIRLMLGAGEQLANIATEDELLHLLCETVSRAGGDIPTLLVAEDGRVLVSRFADQAPPEAAAAAARAAPNRIVVVGAWRVRRIQGAGEEMVDVIWRGDHRPRADAKALDSTIGAFVDRCGGALAQMRLSAKRTEAEVKMRTEKLRNALLASVSHDFRTPLAGILGASTSLLDFPGHNPAIVRDMLSTIKEQAQRLNRYMENLIRAARLEEGAVDVRLTTCNMWDAVADAWEDFAEADASFRQFRVQGASEACGIADPVLVRQVLANILENALKFSPAGSAIVASVHIQGARVALDIIDEGSGVPAEQRERIFDRFYRCPDANAGGTGLGLYICRLMLEAQGGRIEALERPDQRQGLVVRVSLLRGREA